MTSSKGIIAAFCIFLHGCIADEDPQKIENGILEFLPVANSYSTHPRPGKDTVSFANEIGELDLLDSLGYLKLKQSAEGKIDFTKRSIVVFLTGGRGSFADSASIDSLHFIDGDVKVFGSIHVRDKSPALMGCSFSMVSIPKMAKPILSKLIVEKRIAN